MILTFFIVTHAHTHTHSLTHSLTHARCLEDLKEKDLELRKLKAGMQQLQQELSEMQLQREQAQHLLGEQEQSHRNTVEALKKEVSLEQYLHLHYFATRGR